MSRTLLKKNIREARLLFLACFFGLFAFCYLRVFIVSRLEMNSFAKIVGELWDQWKQFSPVSLDQLLSYSGRIAISFDEPIVILCISIFAIARGSDCVSGEIGRGTLEMLLAQPISRVRIILSQGLITLYALALLSAAVWCGIAAGIHTFQIEDEGPAAAFRIPGLDIKIENPFAPREKVVVPMHTKVNPRVFVPAAVNLFCFGVCLAGIATFLSSFDRYRWRTIGLVVGFFILQMIFKLAGVAIKEIGFLKSLTIFTTYEPQKIVDLAVNAPETVWSTAIYDATGRFMHLGPVGFDLVMLGIGLAGYLAAIVIFVRRDIPAPL